MPIALRLRRRLILLVFLPAFLVLLFWLVRDPTAQGILAYRIYLALALLFSADVCRRLAVRYDTEVHRLFYRLMAFALIGIAALLAVVHGLTRGEPFDTAPIASLALFLAPITPAFVLGYFVYRYSFFRIVTRPALLYSALTGIVLSVYLLGVRRIADELTRIDATLRREIVEAVLITFLIFLFQPVKNRLQRYINRLFFRERFEYQNLLRELSQTLNVPLELEGRLNTVVDSIGTLLKVHVVSLTLFDREGEEIRNIRTVASRGLPGFPPPVAPFGRGAEDQAHVEQVVEWLATYRRPLDVGELHRRRFVTPLVSQGVHLCVPLLREERVIGFLCLTEKKRRVPFSAEERELLTTLSNQIALAVENARLVERRLAVERRMFEAERLSSLGLLSASIAHEVKNPLSSIKAIATVLGEDLLGDPAKSKDLGIVLSEIDRLSSVVDRLLKFARPEEEREIRMVPLKPVLDDVVLILSHEADRWGIEIRSEVGQDTVVSGYPEDVKEIFFNLILNGIQAMEREAEGRVLITASGSGEERVEVVVSDTGPGIPPDTGPRIFEPFYTTKPTGTGLGLAIVKRDVERMGGAVEVNHEARDGRGAAFIVRLPGGHDETRDPRCR